MKISVRYESNNNEVVNKFELLRLDAYSKIVSLENINKTYEIMISMKRFLVVGLYLDDCLVGGCYVSGLKDYLFIEQLFIKKEFQNSGLKLGRYLLQSILCDKNKLLEFFNKEFSEVKLFKYDDKSDVLYKKIGFIKDGDTPLLVKKI